MEKEYSSHIQQKVLMNSNSGDKRTEHKTQHATAYKFNV